MERAADSSELVAPAGWWGPIWQRPRVRGLDELVRGGMLDDATADVLRAIVSAGISLTVAAAPSGAGKTTLLTALLPFTPPGRRISFTRGLYDVGRGSWGEPPRTTLLVNEISPHLPIYCWGDSLRAVLAAGRDGAQILATIHADSAAEAVYQLASYPPRLAPDLVAALRVLAFIDLRAEQTTTIRTLREIAVLSVGPRGAGVVHDTLFDARGGLDRALLERLLAGGSSANPASVER